MCIWYGHCSNFNCSSLFIVPTSFVLLNDISKGEFYIHFVVSFIEIGMDNFQLLILKLYPEAETCCLFILFIGYKLLFPSSL